jgi:membrane protein DedA with SNARE-associated domain
MTDPASVWLPFGFQEWAPLVQSVTLALLTFVQEDVPTVSAALLAAAGRLGWAAGFLGCFLGIWIGDALLYWLARGLGRPLLERGWTRCFFDRAAVARSEGWFAQRGTWLLLSSRFVPGTRLPTYLAAGFLRLPFGRFLAVTGTAVAVWTIAIFGLGHALGPELLRWLRSWNSGGGFILLAVVLAVLGIRGATWLGQAEVRRRLAAAAQRWTRWEFWPAWLFYVPVGLHYLWLALRYRGFTLPTAANPGIFSGGFVGESKILTLRQLQETSPEFTAESFLLDVAPPGARLQTLLRLLEERVIQFPFVLKPDVGQRGVGVKLIRSLAQAEACLAGSAAPLVVQRYAPGPKEVGIFYYRFPGETRGRIFATTEKIFPVVVGDGRRSLEELIWADARARLIAGTYLRRLGARRHEVLPAGEPCKLVEAGNHAQGCIFRDGRRLWSEALAERIDAISRRVEGFFIGRYDLRYASDDELGEGRGFQIIELNGAAAEATNIYDARNSLGTAYRTLFRQWELVFEIGARNRRRGAAPTGLALLWRKWRETSALIAGYPLAD